MVLGTREAIYVAFFRLASKKPYEAHTITIADIAKEAQISRQAIYQKHFRNVADIITSINNDIDKSIRAKLHKYRPVPGISPLAIIANEILPFLYEHREKMYIIHTTSVAPAWALFFEKEYKIWIKPYIKKPAERLGVSKTFLLKLYIKQIISVISTWLSERYPDPPEKFKVVFLQLMCSSTNDLVDFDYKLSSASFVSL